jgi:hypothetical protein
MIVTLIRIFFGFVAAALVAGLVQVLFVAGADIGELSSGRLESLGLLVLLAATLSAVFATPFALLAAGFAAWQQIRSPLFFVGAGLAIGLAGFFTQYVGEAGPQTILNRYALAAYAASGLAAGLIYWYVAVPKKRPSKG